MFLTFVRALWHWIRYAYYDAAVTHLLQFDPLHPDLPMLCERARESAAYVHNWKWGRA